jgi:phosphoribosylformylglycinamidine cyclo-ligase
VPPVSGSGDAYARAGVDADAAATGVGALVAALGRIDTGRPRRSLLGSGHYASVLALDERTALAFCTDGVGTKLIVAEQADRYDTVGIDCVAMNVNDLVCVGAEPVAMVDYIAVEQADVGMLAQIGESLRAGAEQAGVEIPGGELAQVPEMLRGHPSPRGIDLVGAAVGLVPRDAVLTGAAIAPGDVVIGLPSSGLHSNGFTLARRALLVDGGLTLQDAPAALGRTLAEELLQPTEIYVRAALDVMRSGADVHGLAHITGDGLLNLTRLNARVGYRIDSPLPAQPVFGLIQERGGIPDHEMWQVFNMGTGFCCVVAPSHVERALEAVRGRHPGARTIGLVTDEAGIVRVPAAGLAGDRAGFGPD